MPNITIRIPEELKEKMDSMEKINWSEIARRAFKEEFDIQHRIDMIRKMKNSVPRSTQEEIEKGRKETEKMSQDELIREFGLQDRVIR